MAQVGLHLEGWSRDQAIAFLARYGVRSTDEIASAVDDMLDVIGGRLLPDDNQQQFRAMLVGAAGSGFVGRGHLCAFFAQRCMEQAA